jgi:hypothetical protein
MESRKVRNLQTFLRREGYWVLKTHGGAFQASGIFDLLIILPNGLSVWVECKERKKLKSPPQAPWKLLRPSQRGFLSTLPTSVPVWLCVWTESGECWYRYPNTFPLTRDTVLTWFRAEGGVS